MANLFCFLFDFNKSERQTGEEKTPYNSQMGWHHHRHSVYQMCLFIVWYWLVMHDITAYLSGGSILTYVKSHTVKFQTQKTHSKFGLYCWLSGIWISKEIPFRISRTSLGWSRLDNKFKTWTEYVWNCTCLDRFLEENFDGFKNKNLPYFIYSSI